MRPDTLWGEAAKRQAAKQHALLCHRRLSLWQGTEEVPCAMCWRARSNPPPPCDIASGCRSFTGPWTVTRSSLRMLRRVPAFCRPLRPVLLLVSFPRSRSPVVGVLGLCWMWRDVPFACQRRPVVGSPPSLCGGPQCCGGPAQK